MPDNWANDANARTIERLTGFLSGEVHANPVEPDLCVWCDYAPPAASNSRLWS